MDYRARLGEACEPQASDRIAGVLLGAGNASAARATESARRPQVAPFAGAGHGGVARPPLGRVSNPFATSLANTRQKALDTRRWASWVSERYSDPQGCDFVRYSLIWSYASLLKGGARSDADGRTRTTSFV